MDIGMDINNIYDYCVNDVTTINKTIYFIGNDEYNSLFTIAIDNDSHKIYMYSNEFLHLIKYKYTKNRNSLPYYNVVSYYKNITTYKSLDISYVDYNVIPFITSFSKGTVHGYSGLFFILNEYIENYNLYKNYKIIVYKDSQKGILDIINYFIDKNIITEQIIYIDSHIQYLFNSIKFIPNKWHTFPKNLNKIDIIDKYIVNENNYLPLENNHICIIKSSLSDNRTKDGIIDIETIISFCSKNKLLFLEPIKMNEIELINRVNEAQIFVTSWGTAFFKNYIYISNKCEKIIVLVIGNAFINQYNNFISLNVLQTKFKNAIISYHIVDKMLNINDLL